MTGVVWGLIFGRKLGWQIGVWQGLSVTGMVLLGPLIAVVIGAGGIAKMPDAPTKAVELFTGLVLAANVLFWAYALWKLRRR